VKQMDFEDLATIVLETRDATIRKVDIAMRTACENTQVILLLGGTGSGKSTTFCFLRAILWLQKEIDMFHVMIKRSSLGSIQKLLYITAERGNNRRSGHHRFSRI